jgi:hypothetical protein
MTSLLLTNRLLIRVLLATQVCGGKPLTTPTATCITVKTVNLMAV